MIFLVIDDAVLFQAGQFTGQSASLRIQVVSQLLAVKGYIKIGGMLTYGFCRKVRQDLVPQRVLRDLRQLFV